MTGASGGGGGLAGQAASMPGSSGGFGSANFFERNAESSAAFATANFLAVSAGATAVECPPCAVVLGIAAAAAAAVGGFLEALGFGSDQPWINPKLYLRQHSIQAALVAGDPSQAIWNQGASAPQPRKNSVPLGHIMLVGDSLQGPIIKNPEHSTTSPCNLTPEDMDKLYEALKNGAKLGAFAGGMTALKFAGRPSLEAGPVGPMVALTVGGVGGAALGSVAAYEAFMLARGCK